MQKGVLSHTLRETFSINFDYEVYFNEPYLGQHTQGYHAITLYAHTQAIMIIRDALQLSNSVLGIIM